MTVRCSTAVSREFMGPPKMSLTLPPFHRLMSLKAEDGDWEKNEPEFAEDAKSRAAFDEESDRSLNWVISDISIAVTALLLITLLAPVMGSICGNPVSKMSLFWTRMLYKLRTEEIVMMTSCTIDCVSLFGDILKSTALIPGGIDSQKVDTWLKISCKISPETFRMTAAESFKESWSLSRPKLKRVVDEIDIISRIWWLL